MADVRVRFTSEGDAAVVAALNRVLDAAQKSGRGAAGGIVSFNKALSVTRGLLAELGVVLSVGAFISMAKDAGEAADSVGRLSKSIGSSLQNFEALATEARISGDNIQSLIPIMSRLAKVSEDAIARPGQPRDALRAIGFSQQEIQQLRSQDTVERAVAVGQKFAQLADGPQKTAAAVLLLGKNAAETLPLLEKLSSKGLGGLLAQAEKLGVLFSKDLVASISATNDEFKKTQLVTEGVFAKFLGGAGESIRGGLQTIEAALVSGQGDWKKWGEAVGEAVRIILTGLSLVLNHVVALGAQIIDTVEAATAAISRLVRGDFAGARAEIDRFLTDTGNRIRNYYKSQAAVISSYFKPAPANEQSPGRTGTANLDASYRQREAVERAALDRSVAEVKAALKLREDAETDSYQNGLTTLRDYYDRRRQILQQGINLEIAALQKQILLIKAADSLRAPILPVASHSRAIEAVPSHAQAGAAPAQGEPLSDVSDRDKEIIQLETKIDALRAQGLSELQKLNFEERKAVQDLGAQRLETEQKILQAQGRTHQARLLEIDQEIEAETRKPGAAEPGRLGQLQDLREALIASADFEQATRDAEAGLAGLARARAQIQDQVDAGLVSQVDGERRVLQVERERLGSLRLLAEQLLVAAEATNDPAKIAQARDFADAVEQIGLHLRAAADYWARLGAAAIDSFEQGLEQFLSTGIAQAKSWGDAWRSAALSVISSLEAVLAKMLATKIVQGLLGLFAGGGSGGGTEIASGATYAALGGPLRRARGGPLFPVRRAIVAGSPRLVAAYAAGGLTPGVGGPTEDANLGFIRGVGPLFFSPKEFLVNAKRTSEPGALPFLERFNREGMSMFGMTRPTASYDVFGGAPPWRALAEGGYLGAAEPGSISPAAPAAPISGRLQVDLNLDKGLILETMDSPEGADVTVRHVAKRRGSIGRALAR